MCVVDLDRCDCSCHYMEGVAHMMPCCYECPICCMRIKPWASEQHQEWHAEQDKQLGELVEEVMRKQGN